MSAVIPLEDGDYILKDDCAWIEVQGFAIRISSLEPGSVVVGVYDNKALASGQRLEPLNEFITYLENDA